MQQDLAIVNAVIMPIALASVALNRRRSRLSFLAVSGESAWAPFQGETESLFERLSGTTLMQLGHSRRITAAAESKESVLRVAYRFETGLAHLRVTHRWTLLTRSVDDLGFRGMVSSQDWLLSVADAPRLRSRTICSLPAPGRGDAIFRMLIDDAEAESRLADPIREFLSRQPPDRTWEVLPNRVVCHQPGRPFAQDLSAMAQSLEEFIKIATSAPKKDGAPAKPRERPADR